MDRVKATQVFIAIVEQGSLVKAADRLGMSRSMVTRYLSEMEEWTGSRLLHRSTRRISLTDAGEGVLTQCYKLQDIAKEVAFTSELQGTTPKGILRIGASQFLAEHILAPFAARFLHRYPNIDLDIVVSNHAVNLVEERIDLAIRITNDLDPNIIARKFGEINSVVVSSEQYLRDHGEPQNINQLVNHNCLTYSYFVQNSWSFIQQGAHSSIAVSGNLTASDPAVLLKATQLGLGISLQPKYAVTNDFKSGQLVKLLPNYSPQPLGVYGIFRSRKHMSKALRLFIDAFAEYTRQLDL